MKFSTILAVFAVALCVAGCKYDKAKKGANAGSDAANASDIFELLMGDQVPPRKEFIVENADDFDRSNIDA